MFRHLCVANFQITNVKCTSMCLGSLAFSNVGFNQAVWDWNQIPFFNVKINTILFIMCRKEFKRKSITQMILITHTHGSQANMDHMSFQLMIHITYKDIVYFLSVFFWQNSSELYAKRFMSHHSDIVLPNQIFINSFQLDERWQRILLYPDLKYYTRT